MRVAIAGAGIAGLTAALALSRQGFAVDVFERSARLEEIGAGIQLSPNAMKVLQLLGIDGELRGSMVEPQAIEVREAFSGRLLTTIPLGGTARRRYGAPYGLIHRGDLQAVLMTTARRSERITIRLGSAVHGVDRIAGDLVQFHAGAESFSADCLIAADGVHSEIRTGYFGHPRARPAGRMAWRATLAREVVPPGFPLDITGLWLGPGAHLVHYPIAGGTKLNVVVIAPAASAPRPPEQPFGRAIRRLIEAAPQWTPWPILTVDPSARWTRGRVALIGDSAHAMLPTAAQGGAQAIEDAWVLASSLAADPSNPMAQLAAYEEARRRRVERISRAAARNLAIYNLRGLPATFRNAAVAVLSPLHLRRLDWIYGWDPATNR